MINVIQLSQRKKSILLLEELTKKFFSDVAINLHTLCSKRKYISFKKQKLFVHLCKCLNLPLPC